MSCDITLYHFASYHNLYNQLTINGHRFLHVASNSWPGSNCWSWRLPEIRTFESYGIRDSMKLVPLHEIIVLGVILNYIILYRMTCHHVSYYVTTLISHSIIWHYLFDTILYYSPILFLMCEIFSLHYQQMHFSNHVISGVGQTYFPDEPEGSL